MLRVDIDCTETSWIVPILRNDQSLLPSPSKSSFYSHSDSEEGQATRRLRGGQLRPRVRERDVRHPEGGRRGRGQASSHRRRSPRHRRHTQGGSEFLFTSDSSYIFISCIFRQITSDICCILCTFQAACDLVVGLKASIAGSFVMIELAGLGGREKVSGLTELKSLFKYH